MPPTAHFASARAELIVVEQTAQPKMLNGKQVGVDPGLYHHFHEHRLTVEGPRSIAFIRKRAQAADSPGIWELDASDVPEVTSLLAELALADPERVRAILDAEESGPARMVVIETARAVLQRSGVVERKPKVTVTA